MSRSICAHLYFAIKLTLGMPLMKVLKNRLKLFTSYWQSTGKNYRNNSNPPHSGHENRRLQLSKMAEPTDAGGHIRALAAEDKTYGETLRRTIMALEEDEVSTTQEIGNRHNRTRQPETSNEGRAEAQKRQTMSTT